MINKASPKLNGPDALTHCCQTLPRRCPGGSSLFVQRNKLELEWEHTDEKEVQGCGSRSDNAFAEGSLSLILNKVASHRIPRNLVANRLCGENSYWLRGFGKRMWVAFCHESCHEEGIKCSLREAKWDKLISFLGALIAVS